MPKCEICYHYDVCKNYLKELNYTIGVDVRATKCPFFKNKSLMLELPVKVGDTVYKLWYTECHNGETYPDSYGCCGCEDECDMQKAIFEIVVPNVRFILDKLMNINNDSVYYLTYKKAEKALIERNER